MAKSKAAATQSQLKSTLRQLHKMGLYNPQHPRRAPTKYAKSIAKKFTELGVVGNKPRADVIHVPKSVAKALGNEFKTVNVQKGAAVIVPKRHGVRTYYSKKAGTIVQKSGSYKFTRYSDSNILLRGEFPTLKRGQRLAVPKRSGFKILTDQEAVLEEMAVYSPGDANVNFWQYPYIVTRG